jgi:uncharacterized protein YbjT (DUF2867 family)
MILVTGAAGKTGRAVIRALSRRGQAVRALVHRPEQASLVTDAGAQQVVVGDMRTQATVNEAARICRAAYHICPNMCPEELAIGQVMVQAAQEAGIEHVVYHSVLHPQVEAMPHHWQKMRVEERLFESGLGYTILQPAVYMQNILGQWERIVGQGVYAVPYAVRTRLSFVDLEDVADAAAVVLTEPGHAGATYELAGAEVLDQTEVAAILEQGLGRPVRALAVDRGLWEQEMRASGLGETQIQTLLQMFRYYERFGFWGNPHALEWLLGRPPTTMAAFIASRTQWRAEHWQ